MTPFAILGPLRVRGPKAQEIAIRGARERALLTWLLLDPGRAVSDDRLIEDLWPIDARDPRKSLQVRVSNLRRALSGVAEIRRSERGYVLAVDSEDVDASRFERLVSESHGQDPAGALRSLESALELWRGDPLPALVDTPSERAAARFTRLRRDAELRRGLALLELGRGEEARQGLADLVASDPLDERSVEGLMRALYRLGRPAEALEVHRHTVERLAEEGLDAGPGHPLRPAVVLLQGGRAGRQPASLLQPEWQVPLRWRLHRRVHRRCGQGRRCLQREYRFRLRRGWSA